MCSEGKGAADSGHGADRVSAWSEMGNGAEEFEGVSLLLERVGWVGLANKLELCSLHLDCLSLAKRADDLPGGGDGAARGEMLDGVVGWGVAVDDNLETGQRRAVVDINEGELLLVADGSDPAFNNESTTYDFVVGGLLDGTDAASAGRLLLLGS